MTKLIALAALLVAVAPLAARATCENAAVNLNVSPVATDQTWTNPDGTTSTLHVPSTVTLGTLSLGCPTPPSPAPACQASTINSVLPAETTDAVVTNTDGSKWTLHIPSAVTVGTLSVACASPPPTTATLANGRYTIFSNGLAPDAGWSPDVGLYTNTTGSGNSCEKWTWNGSTLATANAGTCAGITGFLVDVSGRPKLAATGDKFAMTASGSGWIIQDRTTSRYLALNGASTGDPGSLIFSTNIQTVWKANLN